VSSSAFHSAASTPPGRSTRAISSAAGSGLNQWNAWPTSTASTEASGSGMSSAVPGSAFTEGSSARSTASISGSGSTAVTRADRRTRDAVSFPVPAARSSSSSSPRRAEAGDSGELTGASAQSSAVSG